MNTTPDEKVVKKFINTFQEDGLDHALAYLRTKLKSYRTEIRKEIAGEIESMKGVYSAKDVKDKIIASLTK